VLKTGLIRPKINSSENMGMADYNFSLIDQTGKTLDVKSLKGKVIFLNFWATWCPPCIAEMPDVNELYSRMDSKKVEFLMISVDEDFEKAKHFVRKRGYSFRIYSPASGIPKIFAGNVVPTTYVISPDGRIVVKKEGMAEYNTESFRGFISSIR
jgi:thiol-disulfide isomerase/thioredoxin